jgi:hypothetical protein
MECKYYSQLTGQVLVIDVDGRIVIFPSILFCTSYCFLTDIVAFFTQIQIPAASIVLWIFLLGSGYSSLVVQSSAHRCFYLGRMDVLPATDTV